MQLLYLENDLFVYNLSTFGFNIMSEISSLKIWFFYTYIFFIFA